MWFPMPSEPPHRYAALGLVIASAVPLPELAPLEGDGPADLEIRREAVGPPPPGRGHLYAEGDAACLNAVVGRFRVRGGCEIAVDARPGAAARDVRAFLTGPVLGIVCHQRGWLPLHASAIVVAGRAIAFAGPSGAGKSTLAAHFQARGHAALCDDLCVIDLADGAPRVLPGLPRLKLWPDAVERLGHTPVEIDRAGGPEKHHLRLPTSPADRRVTLERVYVLGPLGEEAAFEIIPLTGIAAVDALMANIFRSQYLAPMGRVGQAFAQTVGLAKRAPVFAVSRSGDLRAFEREVEQIERHFARVAVETASA